MTKIFVSYRRKDSEAITHRLAERLIDRYGRESVFIDIDSIPYGTDVRKRINEVLDECNVCIVVIGTRWMGPAKRRGANVRREQDWVRFEVEEAFRRNINVIPVLVENGEMPREDDLPDSIKKLADINAAPLGNRDFRVHVDRLIEAIDLAVRSKPTKEETPDSRPVPEPVPPISAGGLGDIVEVAPSNLDNASLELKSTEALDKSKPALGKKSSSPTETDGATLTSRGNTSELPNVSSVRRTVVAVAGLVAALAIIGLMVWAATRDPVAVNVSEGTPELQGDWCEISMDTNKTVRLASISRRIEGTFWKREGVFADGFYPYSRMLVDRHGSDVVMGESDSKVAYEYHPKPHEALVLHYLTQGGTADTKYYERAPCRGL